MPKKPNKQADNLKTTYDPTWCPGCGNYGLWGALRKALAECGVPRHKLFAVYGIGCSGNGFNFTKINAFHGLHGRALPVAEGLKLANHDLKVLVMAGDGDAYGEGGNHFLHACRANHDLAYFVHDNQVYGLTTGQHSPTTMKGQKSKSNPFPLADEPVNPVALALVAGATFVARGFTGEIDHLAEIMKAAIHHPGFAFVDILQPCFTYNKFNTHSYFRERIYKLSYHDRRDKSAALELAWQWEREDKIPIGIFYQDTAKPPYHQNFSALEKKPLVKRPLSVNINDIMDKFV